ncbi:hypothetical protein [Erwinia sp. 198]|uniref:hypothetical protein n=1 Tax=Erwinia sp. 198 TaxID=2022746 RepID=UPI000F68DD14|nr:hypothetical protein [Erwinia sp. 198]
MALFLTEIRSVNGKIFISSRKGLADDCAGLSDILDTVAAVGDSLMTTLPEKSCLKGWKMNQRQRRFLESFFPEEEKKPKPAAEEPILHTAEKRSAAKR